MQEVEDGITGPSALESAYAQAQAAVASASRVLELATARYEGGVVDLPRRDHRPAGAAQRRAPGGQLQGQRLLDAVFLVKALGGDWDQPAPAAGS